MNIFRGIVAGGMVAAACTVGMAQLKVQVEKDDSQQGEAVQVQANKANADVDTSEVRATSLIGMMLQDEKGQNLGKVSDIVLDLNNQSIKYVLIGNQSQADAYYAVPPTVLNTRYETNANSPVVISTVPADKFQQAPVFTQQQWTTRGVDPTWSQKNLNFYREYSLRPGVERKLDRQERRIERKLND